MDERDIMGYNKITCVGSSTLERSHSCEKRRCNSVPSAPFFILVFYELSGNITDNERRSNKESTNIIRYKKQAAVWRNNLRTSQSRGRTNNCQYQRKSNRTCKKIWHETAISEFSFTHAMMHDWGGYYGK